MKSLAPCLAVMLAGLALMIAGGFVWITSTPYAGEHQRAFPRTAVIVAPPPSLEAVPVSFPAEWLSNTSTASLARGGEAT